MSDSSIDIPRVQKVKNSLFNRASTADETSFGIDLKGIVILITGASSGIGLETARSLAKRGAHIVLGVRDVKKGAATVESILKSTDVDEKNFTILQIDMTSFGSVRAFAKKFLDTGLKLNILINNAGLGLQGFKITVDGYQETIAVNHLSHFLLTNLLLPKLIESHTKAFPTRIIIVSSEAHQFSKIVWDNFNPLTIDKYDPLNNYAQSKTANILFAKELHRRYHNKHGIIVTSLHPGRVYTPAASGMPIELQTKFGINLGVDIRRGIKSCEQGAATSVWAAVHTDSTISGQYAEDSNYEPNVPVAGSLQPQAGATIYVDNHEEAVKLWDYSLKAVGPF